MTTLTLQGSRQLLVLPICSLEPSFWLESNTPDTKLSFGMLHLNTISTLSIDNQLMAEDEDGTHERTDHPNSWISVNSTLERELFHLLLASNDVSIPQAILKSKTKQILKSETNSYEAKVNFFPRSRRESERKMEQDHWICCSNHQLVKGFQQKKL